MSCNSWQKLHGDELIEAVQAGIMVMDRDLQIVQHNQAFGEVFGQSVGKRCYQVYKDREEPCEVCPAMQSFTDGKKRILEEAGLDQEGHTVNYLAQLLPLGDDDGELTHMAAITTDLTTTKRLQREYQTLFEKVPCYVAVLNRDRRVVKANEMFRRKFGEPRGDFCYKLLKRQTTECEDCPAASTFVDGKSYTSRHIGTAQDGSLTHYVVSTAPLMQADGEISHVIEMSLDVTEIAHLETELALANTLRSTLIEKSLDAIVVMDDTRKVALMNKAAEELWGGDREEIVGKRVPRQMVSRGLQKQLSEVGDSFLLPDTVINNKDGEEIPVRLAGVNLHKMQRSLGSAFIAQDLREIKKLERDKLVAERLAAVGQTVAGLAHGVKNVLMGLEGGMYAFRSGMTKGDNERMVQGWQMLEENIARITSFVKEFLEFAKGRKPTVEMIDPNAIADDVVRLFRDKAALVGIDLSSKLQADISSAPMDGESIHGCVTNLVSNALDACEISDKADRHVIVTTREEDGVLIFEVTDNGTGIDAEIRRKVFTNFFSTKGSDKGTGLGLLTTRKIVQEHGGKVSFESTAGEGSVFRLLFPRDRLPQLCSDPVDGKPAVAGTGSNEESQS